MSAEDAPATQVDDTFQESLEQEVYGEADADVRTWGRLVSHSGELPIVDLKHKDGDSEDEFNEYLIGRNEDIVDVCVNFDARISGKHCRIFCQRAGPLNSHAATGQPVAVFIENLSRNNTFIRTASGAAPFVTLDCTHSKRRLNSGEIITLINPKREKSKVVLDRSSFTFLSENVSFGASAPPPNNFDAVAESPTNDDASHLAFSVTDAVQPSRVVTASYDIHWSAILGKGQFGTVYRATERMSGELFACKILEKNKAMFETQSDITVLLNEVRVLQGLEHPHILTAKDVFLDQSSLYIVLPLCEGGDLFDRIVNKHRKGYPEAEARQLLANIVDAVEYLHLNGVVHRDLKPENLMLMNYHSDVDVRVTDFGLAKKGTHCKTFCGTPAYYAPEVLSRQNTLAGAGMYGAEADCWSIGVIAYVVLSGTPAFPSQMLNESISTGEFVPMTSKKWAACSEASKAFVKALLVVSPSERLTAAQAKQHAWLSMGSHSNQPSVAASKLSKVPMAPPKAKRGILCDGNLPSSSVIEGVSSSSKVPKSE